MLACKFLKTKSFYKFAKRNIYYENTNIERNLDFVFNLGYNNIAESIKSNIGIFTLFKLLANRRLNKYISSNYINLLNAIVICNREGLDKLLEPKLKLLLYSDLSKLGQENFEIKLVNPNESVYVKFLSYYELENINIDRNLNGDINNYFLDYKGKNKIRVTKDKASDPSDYKTYGEIEKERKLFEQSEHKANTLNKLKEDLYNKFNLEYARKKIGTNALDKEIEYIANIIEHLNKDEQHDPYIKNLKEEFSDYFIQKDRYIHENIEKTDLYLYFKEKSPGLYKKLFSKKEGFLKSLTRGFKNRFKNTLGDKKMLNNKTLCVIDVEIVSKMRLEITAGSENILDSVYSYSRIMRNSNRVSAHGQEYLNYDTSIYNFKLPEHKWDLKNKEFTQSHVVRFEFEKKGFFNNLLKNPYKNMLITDIDLALKGNKHFSFEV
jgi:hypothetical protein